MAELKPCPFCGNSVKIDYSYYYRDYVIYCNDCDMIFSLDDCAFMPPPSGVHCGYWKSDTQTVNRWISVEDALPERNGCYLVWRPRFYIDGDRECGEATICYFDGHDTWHDSYGVDFSRVLGKDDITHWMPLPEPPKE